MAFNVVLVVLARLVVRRNDAAQGSGRLVSMFLFVPDVFITSP